MAIQEKKIKFPYKSEVSFETANRRFIAKIYVHRIATLISKFSFRYEYYCDYPPHSQQ